MTLTAWRKLPSILAAVAVLIPLDHASAQLEVRFAHDSEAERAKSALWPIAETRWLTHAPHPMNAEYRADVEAILAKRHSNGGDFWATSDDRIYVGGPFSTLASLGMLYELDVDASLEAVAGALHLVLDGWQDDGRIRLAPKAPLYPCYTAEAARVLCRFGYADDPRVQLTAAYFLDSAHDTGGWRCNFTRFGRGPETACANPGATIFVLDVLRWTGHEDAGVQVERAVESLLAHWEARVPCGPCHYGIGDRFMQVEFPFLRYNLFYYVYVLSFFPAARADRRFAQAAEALASKVDPAGRMVVEQPHRSLKGLAFCRCGEPSVLATRRYREVLTNVRQ